jgi:hypothetical protein
MFRFLRLCYRPVYPSVTPIYEITVAYYPSFMNPCFMGPSSPQPGASSDFGWKAWRVAANTSRGQPTRDVPQLWRSGGGLRSLSVKKSAYYDMKHGVWGNRLHSSKDRHQRWALVNTVMNLRVPYTVGNFFISSATIKLLNKDSAPWSWSFCCKIIQFHAQITA